MDLHPSEHVLYLGRPSWRSILRFYLLGLVAAIAGGLIAWAVWVPGWAVLVFVLIVIAVLIAGWAIRIGTRYQVTNERLRIRRGVLARRTQETRLERIQNVNTNQSVFERMLRIGTVDFDTAGTDDSDFAFRGVAHPDAVSHAVDQAVREVDLGVAAVAPPPVEG